VRAILTIAMHYATHTYIYIYDTGA